MDSGVNAICECGLQATIRIGDEDNVACYFPCVCRDCEDVVQADVSQLNPKCPKCDGEDVIRYDDPRLLSFPGRSVVARSNMGGKVVGRSIQTLELNDGRYKCPRCGSPTLKFSAA